MSKYRTMFRTRLKPECVQEYVRQHQQVWPELLAAYREAGITQISCFLNGLDLIVYSEYESEIYDKEKDALSHNPTEVRWQALMKTLRDPGFEAQYFDEVFYMSPEVKTA